MSRQIMATHSTSLKPRIFKEHSLYKQIEDAGNLHRSRLNFILNAGEMLQLLSNQPYSKQIEELLMRKLEQAEDKVDKRPIQKQREVRNKYQLTHGLVFKNIPYNIPRQVLYDAILKLGQIRKDDGTLVFPGELKMRSFMYPENRKAKTTPKNGFPVFVRQTDRNMLLEWAKRQESRIQLRLENSEEHRFRIGDWNGVVLVEPVRGDNGEFQTGKKVEDPIEPPMTMEAERYGAKTPPIPIESIQPNYQNLPYVNIMASPVYNQQLTFRPYDINQLNQAGSSPISIHQVHTGASTPRSFRSNEPFRSNVYPSSQVSPVGSYTNQQQAALSDDFFGKLQSSQELNGPHFQAGGDCSIITSQKVVRTRSLKTQEQPANKKRDTGKATPISDNITADEID